MFDSIETVVAALAIGEIVVLTDDENRENEGDLICAGSFATPENINFMLTYGRGVLCAPVTPEIAERLLLKLPDGRHDPRGTAFSQSLDAINGNTTGVSAYDRARTIAEMMNPLSTIDHFYSPGHLYPLLGKPHGVLERNGHTEGTLDLIKMANLPPVGVLCEILNKNGTMARLPDLKLFCKKHHLKWCSVAMIIEYRQSLRTSSQ